MLELVVVTFNPPPPHPAALCALPALELGNDHDGAEGLLLCNVHVVLHVGEHGGLKEEA